MAQTVIGESGLNRNWSGEPPIPAASFRPVLTTGCRLGQSRRVHGFALCLRLALSESRFS